MIECLNAYNLKNTLTRYEEVRLSVLILSYSTANCNKDKYIVSFEIQGDTNQRLQA